MRAVSLFSGCGGMDLGFRQAGFDILHAIDNDPAAVAVHAHNFGRSAEVADITTIDFRRWRKDLPPLDAVLGGFPCQGFSKAGPKRADDPRNVLYRAMLEAVAELRPTYFIAENVEGLAQNFAGQYLQVIHQDFAEIGYEVSTNLVDAIGYGIPQHRRRIIFVGQLKGTSSAPFRWPSPPYSVTVRNGETARPKAMSTSVHGSMPDGLLAAREPRTIRDAISDLRSMDACAEDHAVGTSWPAEYKYIIKAIGPGQKLCNVRHGPESVRTWDVPEAFGFVTGAERLILETIARNRRHKRYGPVPNGNPLPVAVIEQLTGLHSIEPTLIDLCRRGYAKQRDSGYDLLGGLFNSGLFKRPDWDGPSPTVLTNFGNPRFFLHPLEDRPFSLRETARLQGFPDDFVFTRAGVSLADGYRLAGNAVPPPLAEALATSVRSSITSPG